jgi:hypothetical protein
MQPPARTLSCAICGARAAHHHHWLSQELLRVYVASRRLRDPVSEDAMLNNLIHDKANLSALCLTCHGPYGTTTENLRACHVPPEAWEFAEGLGPEWLARLERAYAHDEETAR